MELTKELVVKLIANSSVAGDMETVTILTEMLNEIEHPVEKKKRSANNTSGYIQMDIETGKMIAKFDTVKAANEAMGKKASASCISAACRNLRDGKSNVAYGYKWCYGADYNA